MDNMDEYAKLISESLRAATRQVVPVQRKRSLISHDHIPNHSCLTFRSTRYMSISRMEQTKLVAAMCTNSRFKLIRAEKFTNNKHQLTRNAIFYIGCLLVLQASITAAIRYQNSAVLNNDYHHQNSSKQANVYHQTNQGHQDIHHTSRAQQPPSENVAAPELFPRDRKLQAEQIWQLQHQAIDKKPKSHQRKSNPEFQYASSIVDNSTHLEQKVSNQKRTAHKQLAVQNKLDNIKALAANTAEVGVIVTSDKVNSTADDSSNNQISNRLQALKLSPQKNRDKLVTGTKGGGKDRKSTHQLQTPSASALTTSSLTTNGDFDSISAGFDNDNSRNTDHPNQFSTGKTSEPHHIDQHPTQNDDYTSPVSEQHHQDFTSNNYNVPSVGVQEQEFQYHQQEAQYPTKEYAPNGPQQHVDLQTNPANDKQLPGIRVVFNNNPQFIIGSSSGGEPSNRLLGHRNRYTRQPSSSLFDDAADSYRSDESTLDETKIAASRAPCVEQATGKKSAQNLEQVDLQQTVKDDNQQVELPSKGDSPPAKQRPRSEAPPLIVKEPAKTFDDQQQVVTPLDQMIKSGLRPPLRMVISMRNKLGEAMKIPVNFQGDAGEKSSSQLPTQADENLKTALQEKVQSEQNQLDIKQQVEQPKTSLVGDENTPKGGDIFDPSFTKPFGKLSKTTKSEALPIPMPQVMDQLGQTKRDESPDCNQKKTGEDTGKTTIESDKQISEYPAMVLPMQFNQAQQSEGIVHMMMPRLTRVKNETFASMFAQFQQALGEQMKNHFVDDDQQRNTEDQQRNSEEQQQQVDQRRDDDQEDLMVALMATNVTASGNKRRFGAGQAHNIAMTVIRPPKGTTLQQAIMKHSPNGGNSQTVAILRSSPRGTNQFETTPNPATTTTVLPANDGVVPVAFDVNLRSNPDSASRLDINRMQPTPANLPTSDGGIDPDGFSSSSSEQLSTGDTFVLQTEDNLSSLPAFWRDIITKSKRNIDSKRIRSKRSTLEPEDKLVVAKRVSTRVSTARPLQKTVTRTTRRPQSRHLARQSHRKQPDSPRRGTKNVEMRRFPGRARQEQKKGTANDAFLASASQNNEVSADEEDEEEDADESEQSPSSSESSSSSSDEPSVSASGDTGTSGDENDYTNGSDDFDDSSGFDSDDEPFNQVASSDRNSDYNTFEIPQIDLNPNTLQQKGCRTVLREVQEIPMNGLGVLQSNGKPGSGFTAAGSEIAGLRVRRATNNDNLINSRKVTSIVMTKECHFPNDQSKDQQQKQQQRKGNSRPAPMRPPLKPQRQVVVEPLAFGGQSGASQPQPTLTRMRPHQVPVAVAARQPSQLQVMYQPAISPVKLAQNRSTKLQNLQPQIVNFYGPAASMSSYQKSLPYQKTSLATKPPQAVVNYIIATNQQQKPPSQTLVRPQQSSIKRRSVTTPAGPHVVQLSPIQQFNSHQQRQLQPNSRLKKADQAGETYLSAASGIVARKLYKPPSDDDPYHTLSYTSQTGADPDMEQDDDDSVVMGPEPDDSAPASSRSNPRQSHANTLSARERAALADPNYDDTDPGEVDRNEAGKYSSDRARDSDETDGDFTDESRRRRQISPAQKERRQMHQAIGGANSREKQFYGMSPVAKRPAMQLPQQAIDRKRVIRGPKLQVGVGVEPRDNRFGKSFKFEHEISRRAQMPIKSQGASLNNQLSSLSPGRLHGFVKVNGDGLEPQKLHSGAKGQQQQLRRSLAEATRRQDDDDDDDGDDDDEDGDGGSGRNGRGRGNQMAASAPNSEDADSAADPDADPEYNPVESKIPANNKPKRYQKSFAYVHRDLPKKGTPNSDDFVVSYGRGNVQSEHEDYDSDKDNTPAEDSRRARAASNRHVTRMPVSMQSQNHNVSARAGRQS